MTKVYLFRHGQASFGSQDYDRLSPVGLRQSQILARHLDAYSPGFDAVYCGRMKRQQDTAKPLCDLLSLSGGPTVMTAFDEYNSLSILAARARLSQPPDGLDAEVLEVLRADRRAFQRYFAETVNRWIAGKYDDEEDVEPWGDFCRRVNDGVRKIVGRHGPGKRLAVFTSGGPISVIIQAVLGLAHHMTVGVSWQIMNASLTCIRYMKNDAALTEFNNTTHLLLEKDTGLLTYR